MSKHVCVEGTSCRCSVVGLEPAEDCPIHGYPWPPQCCICGRFMPWPKPLDDRAAPTTESQEKP